MARKRKFPHEDVVFEIKRLIANANDAASIRWDDDMDQYYVEKAGYSPMGRRLDTIADYEKKAKSLAATLTDLGEEAADAVAKGIRMRGRFRELLLPYAEHHRDLPVVRETLKLVARRKVDPLALVSARILAGEGYTGDDNV